MSARLTANPLRWLIRSSALAVMWIAALILPAGAAEPDLAARADVLFEHFAQEPQLGGSFPTGFAQDRDGFLWIATEGSLGRFDGYAVKRYSADRHDSQSLPPSGLLALHVDGRGRLWIATKAAGVARYDRERDRFVRYSANWGAKSNVGVEDIADDGQGGLWFGTDYGVAHLAADNAQLVPFAKAGLPPMTHVNVLRRDRSGTLWAGSRQGLWRLRKGERRFVIVDMPAQAGSSPRVDSIIEDTRGTIWIGTFNSGVFFLAPGSNRVRPLTLVGPAPVAAAIGRVSDLAEVRPGELWIATPGRGIVALDSVTRSGRVIKRANSAAWSLLDDDVLSLFVDRLHRVWVITANGICTADLSQTAVLTLLGGTGRPDSIADSNVSAVRTVPGGDVWLGLNSVGIDIIQAPRWRIRQIRSTRGAASGLPSAEIFGVAAVPPDLVFVATHDGLYETRIGSGHFERVRVRGRDPGALVTALFVDGDELWLAGDDAFGVIVDHRGGIRPLAHIRDVQLSDRRVRAFARAPDGGLWIGTSNGLNRYDRRAGRIERIMARPTDPTGLSGNDITALLVDRRGRLWITTQGGGISVLDDARAGSPRRFRRIGEEQGLPHDNVDGLVEDDTGSVWASTDFGLARIDERTFAVRALQVSDGVAISNYWSGATAKTAHGELLFGGVGGLTVVRPNLLQPWRDDPPVAVTALTVGGKSLVPAHFAGLGGKLPVEIGPHGNTISVDFAALDLSAPERNRYAYKLDGFDSDWIDTDAAHRQAAYTNLAPGSYALHIRGSNRDGHWSSHEIVIPLRVHAAWHQTIWFKLLELAVIGMLAAGASLLRVRFLQARARELEAEVERRTAELLESQRQLEILAYHDQLTGLANRRMFNAEFRRFIATAERQGEPFALLLIDLDHFKAINDTFGHDAGDALLVEATARLRGVVREIDCVARLGGDEFAILAGNLDGRHSVDEICRRLVAGFERAIAFGSNELRTSPSIGVGIFPLDGGTPGELYKAADLALYEAKRSGRNTWRRFSTAPPASAPLA